MVTKKEMNELEEKYDALMQEALAIQEVAKDRLVLLKVFESFFNNVNAAVNRARGEFLELQSGQVQEAPTEDGGSE